MRNTTSKQTCTHTFKTRTNRTDTPMQPHSCCEITHVNVHALQNYTGMACSAMVGLFFLLTAGARPRVDIRHTTHHTRDQRRENTHNALTDDDTQLWPATPPTRADKFREICQLGTRNFAACCEKVPECSWSPQGKLKVGTRLMARPRNALQTWRATPEIPGRKL